jgi:hypothetical protein
MNTQQLSRLLYDLGVPPDAYRLDGSHLELAHVLAERRGKWAVFLSERGGESGAIEFDNEHVACSYFLGEVAESLVRRGRLAVVDPPGDAARP